MDDAPPRSGQKIAFAILGGLLVAIIAVVAIVALGKSTADDRQASPAASPSDSSTRAHAEQQPVAAEAPLKEDPTPTASSAAVPTAAPRSNSRAPNPGAPPTAQHP